MRPRAARPNPRISSRGPARLRASASAARAEHAAVSCSCCSSRPFSSRSSRRSCTSGSTSGTGAASDDRPLETNITHGLISDAVVAYRDVVADYAEQNDISEYTDVLLAIMQVESGG